MITKQILMQMNEIYLIYCLPRVEFDTKKKRTRVYYEWVNKDAKRLWDHLVDTWLVFNKGLQDPRLRTTRT